MNVRSLIVTAALLFSTAFAQPTIVASIHPYYDLMRQIAGADAEVIRILPPDASPHTFDPTPRDVRAIAGADLVVINGGLDEWLLDLVEASGTDAPVVEVFELLSFQPIQGEDDHAHDDDMHGDDMHSDGVHSDDMHEDEHHDEEHHDDMHGGDHEDEHHDDMHSGDDAHGESEHNESEHDESGHDDHSHEGENPHVWLDPVLMIQAVPMLRDALIDVDPANVDLYTANADALVESLEALHAELSEQLAVVAGAPFVPFHDAWPYFARRYGLDLIVEIEPFPGREPSPRYLAEALDLIADSGATVIFSERQLPENSARVVADAAGVDLYVLDPVGGGDIDSYQDLLRYNADIILNAFSDSARR